MTAPSRSLIRELAPVAARQHGVFTRAQVLALGASARLVDRRLERGDWTPVDRGVYRFATTPVTWHQRILAACLAGPAVASHRTAAALDGIPGFSGPGVEVTALRHRRRKAPDVVWHESYHIEPVDVVERAGIPTTMPARTFADLAVVLDDAGLVHVCDEYVRRGLASILEMHAVLERLGARRPGAARARRVLELRLAGGDTPESALESELDALIRRFGLPRPERQHLVADVDGIVARLDFAYVDLGIAIEADGEVWHGSPSARVRDARRDDRLRALDWLVLRFTTWDIRYRPEWVATEIDTARRRRSVVRRTHGPTMRP